MAAPLSAMLSVTENDGSLGYLYHARAYRRSSILASPRITETLVDQGASNFNDLGFWARLGLKSVQYSRTKSPPSPSRGHWESAYFKFLPGPVRPGFPELRGSSTSSRKLSS